MKMTHLNSGEVVIEPFWDPQMSGFEQWQVADGSDSYPASSHLREIITSVLHSPGRPENHLSQ